MDETYETLARGWSKRLGAARTWIVPGGTEHLGHAFGDAAVVEETLGRTPISCADIRADAARAEEAGRFLVVDNTEAGSFGCPAVRLGAAIAVESLDSVLGWLGSGLIAVSVAEQVPDAARELVASLDGRPRLSERMCEELARALLSFDARRRGACDAAQVAASYLACHPKVVEVRYPGLRSDPSYAVAARTLEAGFGPIVDFRLRQKRPDLESRILCAPGNSWLPGGIASRLSVGKASDGALWCRLVCGHGRPEALVEALEASL